MNPKVIDDMSRAMREVYAAATDRILINLARHFPYLQEDEQIRGSFDYQARMLAQMGQVNKETVTIIADSLSGADEALRTSLETAITEALKTEEPALRKAAKAGMLYGQGDTPAKLAPNMMQAFKTYYKQSADKLNLVNTVMLESTEEAYKAAVSDIAAKIERAQYVLNTETGEVISGVTAYNAAVRDGVRKMVDNGLTGFIDHGGHRWTPESYVAMDIKTTMHNTAREAVWERNKDYGNDLYQVSSHNGARPLCYPWQGKVLSTSGRTGTTTDLDGNVIPIHSEDEVESFRYGGGLFGVNCGHYPMVFIPGVSTIKADPQSPEENAETYAESQQQRALERKLREEKRELEIMKAQGAPDEEIRAQRAKVRRASSDIDAFCDETGRTRRRANEYTPVNASWDGAKVPPYGVPVENVTYEYRVKSKPNSHEIIEQPGYKQGNKHEEVPVANRIKETFGGEIILHADEKKPHPHNFDYIWNGKNWELKTPETFGGIDKLIHKGIHQIEENPGGIIVDCKNLTEERAEILRQVFDRISRSASYSLDIIMLYDDSYRVYKYKKR